MKYNNIYGMKRKRFTSHLLLFSSSLIVFIFIFFYIHMSLSPIIIETAKKRSRAYTTYAVSDTMSHILDSGKDMYGEIIELEKNNDGDISALKTNMIYVNKLKASLSTEIYSAIYKIREEELSFNMGTALGNMFLQGIGPMIKVRINTVSAVDTEFEHEFLSGGINQTNHRIYIRVSATYSLLVPFRTITENINTSFCIAENIIVGKTPDAFTNVQNYGGNEDANVADEVVDFGAHVNLD